MAEYSSNCFFIASSSSFHTWSATGSPGQSPHSTGSNSTAPSPSSLQPPEPYSFGDNYCRTIAGEGSTHWPIDVTHPIHHVHARRSHSLPNFIDPTSPDAEFYGPAAIQHSLSSSYPDYPPSQMFAIQENCQLSVHNVLEQRSGNFSLPQSSQQSHQLNRSSLVPRFGQAQEVRGTYRTHPDVGSNSSSPHSPTQVSVTSHSQPQRNIGQQFVGAYSVGPGSPTSILPYPDGSFDMSLAQGLAASPMTLEESPQHSSAFTSERTMGIIEPGIAAQQQQQIFSTSSCAFSYPGSYAQGSASSSSASQQSDTQPSGHSQTHWGNNCSPSPYTTRSCPSSTYPSPSAYGNADYYDWSH